MRQNCLRYLLWITCTLWSATAFAQDQRLALDYFGENKGLNITRINDIRQDKTGFLWIATREGLVRYDGHTFKYFRNQPGDTASLSSNHIQCLAEDADGNIWSGLLRGGVSRYDRKSGAFRNYPFTEKLKLKTAPVSGIFFDRGGNLWLGMEPYGLIRLDQKTGDFKQYDLVTAETAPHLNPDALVYSNAAYQFWQDENGIIWCTTRDGLYRFDPKTERAKPQRAPGFNSKEAEYRQTYTLQPDGDLLWMGGWASGLQCFNRKTGAWKQYFFNSAFGKSGVTNVINHIEPKNAEELWVSTMDMGLGIFNKKTERFYFLAHDTDAYPDLPDAQANVFCVDGQGHLWINLNNQLARIQLKDRIFQFNQVRSLRTVPQYQSHISTLFEDREGRFLFIGMFDGDGLHIVDKKTGKVVIPDFPTLPGLERAPRTVMGIHQSPDGTIWVLTRYLICRFNPATMRLEKPVQPPVFVPEYTSNLYNQFSEEPGGNLWLCSSLVGVFRYNPRTGKTIHFMPDENKPGAIATNIVGSIAVDRRGRVWYGSRSKTAYGYYLPEEERFIYLDAQGMVTRELTTLYLSSFYTDDKGDIWACTEQGLLHFDCSGDQPRLLRKYTIADGLRSDFVIGATQDQDGHIWALLVGSLCRLDTGTGKITAFGKRDGFPDAISGVGCLRNGTLYLKSEYGYYTIDPAALVPYRSTAPLVLSSFKVDDRERYHGSQSVPSQPFVIPADSRFFSVEFAAIDFDAPEAIQYEYQLDGYDGQWVRAGTRRYVNYTNIPAGRYIFKVKQAGAPDNESLSVPLKIEISFFKTWWFWLAILGLLGVIGAGYFRRRRAHQRQVIELKSRTQLLEKEMAVVLYESLKQQLNPHFLFNSLTSLSSLIQVDPKAAAIFLDHLSKSYRYILKSSERELVPLSEELKFAESFVRLQKTRFETGLEVHFNIPEEFFHRKIVPVTLQNLLENAIKHNIIDEETPLVVDVFIEDDCLVVRNNLQRKKFVETSNRKGLLHLQSFYQYLSDRRIETAEDTHSYTIKIPLI